MPAEPMGDHTKKDASPGIPLGVPRRESVLKGLHNLGVSHRGSMLNSPLISEMSEKSRKYATYAAMLCVFCDAINLQCCAPNYPLMVTVGEHPSSFPSTEPFGIGAAQYVISGATKIGIVISSLIFGYFSGKIGARKSFLILMIGSAVLTVAKYFARGSFWVFTALCFANGLFGSSAATASGYMCLLYSGDRVKADTFIGAVLATMVLGRGLGGLFTLMFPGNLFLPLIPAAVINVFACSIACKFVKEPDFNDGDCAEQVGGEDYPKSFHMRTLINIVVGALLDNIGSLAVVPLGLSPVMYEAFFLNPQQNGLEPVMSENQFRWLYSMTALLVIPPALASPVIFKKVGVALSCVIGNLMTACIIALMLFIAQVEPVTTGSFALYVCVLYIGFPITIISNLSSGPMLDRVTPLDKKTMIQGVNAAIFDASGAIFAFVFGLIADKKGNSYFMWICVAISIFAALINLPLVFDFKLGRGAKKDQTPIAQQQQTEDTTA